MDKCLKLTLAVMFAGMAVMMNYVSYREWNTLDHVPTLIMGLLATAVVSLMMVALFAPHRVPVFVHNEYSQRRKR